jgi:hypothetical protein
MKLNPTSRIHRSAGLLSADAGDELVMMSVEAGAYYSLDQIGRRIWDLIAEPATVGALCARLVAEYEVTPEDCQAQVLSFLDQLAEHRMIEVLGA